MKIKLSGRILYVWTAREMDSGEIVAIRATLRKRGQDALLIIEDVLVSCPNQMIVMKELECLRENIYYSKELNRRLHNLPF
ncbi:MAG: hypothetical protein QXP74_04210 [Nitrososphaerota archaeon]